MRQKLWRACGSLGLLFLFLTLAESPFPTFRHYLLLNGHTATGGPAQSLELLESLPFL